MSRRPSWTLPIALGPAFSTQDPESFRAYVTSLRAAPPERPKSPKPLRPPKLKLKVLVKPMKKNKGVGELLITLGDASYKLTFGPSLLLATEEIESALAALSASKPELLAALSKKKFIAA